MIEKSGFVVNMPFQRWRKFWIWAALTLLIVVVQLGVSGWWLWQRYQVVQQLQIQNDSLQSALKGYDEIVRKKNKLLAKHEAQTVAVQGGSRAQQVSLYLTEIERAVPAGVHLTSLSFLEQKIELMGVTQILTDLSAMIVNLQKLGFVAELSLEQVVVKNMTVSDQYQFTINLKLQL